MMFLTAIELTYISVTQYGVRSLVVVIIDIDFNYCLAV